MNDRAADALPPRCDVDTERAVLGCVLTNPELLATVTAKLGPEDFANNHHRLTLEGFLELDAQGRKIDSLSLGQWLVKRGAFNAVGGGPFVMGLSDCGVTSAHLEDHVAHLAELSAARRVGKAAGELHRKARDPSVPLPELLEAAQRLGDGVAAGAAPPVVFGAAIDKVLNDLAYPTPQGAAIETGFRDYDAQLSGGFRAEQLIIWAARPAMGKTAAMLQACIHVARTTRRWVLVFSLEMSQDELVLRALAAEAGINVTRVLSRNLGPDDMVALTGAAARLYDIPLLLLARDELRLHELRAIVQHHAARCDLALVALDYLQLLKPTKDREDRQREVAEMSRGLKSLAKRCKVAVLALSQLNRDCEKRADKRPQQSDLRESGAIEQDADVITFMFREHVYNKNADATAAEFITAKQRSGPPGTVHLQFIGEQTKFKNDGEQPRRAAPQALPEAAPSQPVEWSPDERHDSGEWEVGNG